MERAGGVMVYDVTNPNTPIFVDINIPRDTADGSGDQAPEGLVFISKADSPTNKMYLIASCEASNTLSVWEVNDTLVGLAENKKKISNLNVFPNPANDRVFVTADEQIEMIEIYDLSGRAVQILEEPNQIQIINVTSLSPNMYLLRIHTANGIETRKLQIQ
jgi:WD40 repeat protein